jgi:hypothetical protein
VVGSGSDGVQGLISSFDSTTSAFRGTKPVALKPALMLLDKKTLWCTARNTARNASLSMLLMWLFARAPISFLYARFKGEKQPTSRGCRIWEACAGIQRVIMLFSLQIS